MYLMNYHLYANEANYPRMLAEDTGAAELRDPVFCVQTDFHFRKPGWFSRLKRKRTVCACRPRTAPAY